MTVNRVVSLVPSITEALVTVRREAVVGATDWCTHPADLDDTLEARVRGTKNPDLAEIRALNPDLVIANKEENRELDVRRLRESGVEVVVTEIATVEQAVQTYQHLFDDVLDWPQPDWLVQTAALIDRPLPPVIRRVAMAIWRDPWMVIGPDTFTGDLLRQLGWENIYDPAIGAAARPAGARSGRYPTVELADLDAAGADVVLLPDEPYVFTATDGPQAFEQTPTELVSGRALTWYGPSLVETLTSPDGIRR